MEQLLEVYGDIKKKLAIAVFRQLVNESVLSDEDVLLMTTFLQKDLPDLIDVFKSLGTSIAREWRRRKCFGCFP